MKKILLFVTISLSLLTVMYAQTVPYGRCDTFKLHQTNLVAHYNFSTASSAGTIIDLSGNGHSGTRVGMVMNANDAGGHSNCSVEFPGLKNNHIRIDSSSDFDFVRHPGTISLWYRPKETSTRKFEWLAGRGLGRKSCSNEGEFYVGIFDCRRPMAVMNSIHGFDHHVTSVNCDVVASSYFDQWHHVVAVFDTGWVKTTYPYAKAIYVDGLCVNIWGLDSCGPVSRDVGDFYLGEDFKGFMDDVRIYNVAFTASDVSALYAYGIMGCCKPATDLPEINNDMKIRIYPNPSTGSIQMDFPKRFVGGQFNIFNQFGKIVFHGAVLNGTEHLDLQYLSPGAYIIDCSTSLENIHTRQVLTIQ